MSAVEVSEERGTSSKVSDRFKTIALNSLMYKHHIFAKRNDGSSHIAFISFAVFDTHGINTPSVATQLWRLFRISVFSCMVVETRYP